MFQLIPYQYAIIYSSFYCYFITVFALYSYYARVFPIFWCAFYQSGCPIEKQFGVNWFYLVVLIAYDIYQLFIPDKKEPGE